MKGRSTLPNLTDRNIGGLTRGCPAALSHSDFYRVQMNVSESTTARYSSAIGSHGLVAPSKQPPMAPWGRLNRCM